MVTDTERREVARRLREMDDSELQVYDMTYFAIQHAVGSEGDQYPDGRELADRLADLIEPSCDRDTPQKVAEEMFGKMRHSTKEEADAYDAMLKSKSVEIHPVDRDALLELADEMQGYADGAASGDGFPYVNAGSLWSYADRIRDALGEAQA